MVSSDERPVLALAPSPLTLLTQYLPSCGKGGHEQTDSLGITKAPGRRPGSLEIHVPPQSWAARWACTGSWQGHRLAYSRRGSARRPGCSHRIRRAPGSSSARGSRSRLYRDSTACSCCSQARRARPMGPGTWERPPPPASEEGKRTTEDTPTSPRTTPPSGSPRRKVPHHSIKLPFVQAFCAWHPSIDVRVLTGH